MVKALDLVSGQVVFVQEVQFNLYEGMLYIKYCL